MCKLILQSMHSFRSQCIYHVASITYKSKSNGNVINHSVLVHISKAISMDVTYIISLMKSHSVGV